VEDHQAEQREDDRYDENAHAEPQRRQVHEPEADNQAKAFLGRLNLHRR